MSDYILPGENLDREHYSPGLTFIRPTEDYTPERVLDLLMSWATNTGMVPPGFTGAVLDSENSPNYFIVFPIDGNSFTLYGAFFIVKLFANWGHASLWSPPVAEIVRPVIFWSDSAMAEPVHGDSFTLLPLLTGGGYPDGNTPQD